MLVLSRKINEKIKIGNDIEITVIDVSGDIVKIGIEAPRNVRILRNEVYEEVQKQNREALLKAETAEQLHEIIKSQNGGPNTK
ncbi:MAG: carbon storage regulator CsrA [Bacillota bacterium]|jgi:carbon storage regulator